MASLKHLLLGNEKVLKKTHKHVEGQRACKRASQTRASVNVEASNQGSVSSYR